MLRKFRYSTIRRHYALMILIIISSATSFGQNSIFQPTDVPATLNNNDGSAIEVGLKFRSTVAGTITGIRFYKSSTNTGTHIGHLWSTTNTTTPLTTVQFTGETASGWQQMLFPNPIGITAGTTYVISYFSSLGNYSSTMNYFTSAVVNGPLRALADGEDGPNGVFKLPATSSPATYPNSTFNSNNYWVDVVFVVGDVAPPLVSSTTPANGATGVNTGSSLTAVFNEALDATTVTSSTFLLQDAATNAFVPATVTYNNTTHTATLDPTGTLTPFRSYTGILKGGNTGPVIKDVAGNAMSSDYTWTFTTPFDPPPAPENGPGGPILVLYSSTNAFSRFPVEILRAEGLNEFAAVDISTLSSSLLNNYDVVILGEMALSAANVTALTNWVNAGGTLVAFRPDAQLNSLMGLSTSTGTLSDKYLLVNTSSGPGLGIVNQTMQFHGPANLQSLTGGSVSLATLYSDASTATTNPAITSRTVGSGKAIAFTFDLARSIVYTRQGNPAQAAQETDGQTPIRSDDLYFPSYLDMNKVEIPQADEQQRLLANIIIQSNLAKKPLPRLWYLPGSNKAAIIYALDDHSTATGTKDIFNKLLANSPAGGNVTNWTAYRGTSWFYVGIPLADSSAARYQSLGFEMGVHVTNNCVNFTSFADLNTSYNAQLQSFQISYPSLAAQTTHRFHCIVWSDWLTQAKVELSHGIRYSMDYYYWPPAWINNRPGLFTGSGIPMRFADSDGSMLNVYQGVSQLVNENGVGYSLGVNTLLDNALGSKGYYGLFGTHDDYRDTLFSTAIITAAKNHNVPIISAKQALTWIDGRNNSSIGSMTWNNNQLSFSVTAYTGADNLKVMLPLYSSNGQLNGLTRNGSTTSFTTQTIKGIQYAFFDAPVGVNDFIATYLVDATPPVISNIVATPNTNGVSATITWTTNEGSDSKVDYGTNSSTLNLNSNDNSPVTSHSIVLNGLTPGTTYFFRVTSRDVIGNSATSPVTSNSPLSFTTPTACASDVTGADFSGGTTGSNTDVDLEGDGGIVLKPGMVQEFSGSTIPSGWSAGTFNPGGGTTVSNGRVTVNGTHVYTNATVAQGTSLEFSATFNLATYQNVGFTSDQAFATNPWVTIGQAGGSDGNVYARASDGSIFNLGSNLLGSPHRYRINWNATSFTFYVDGSSTPAATINLTVASGMFIQISDVNVEGSGGMLSVDWIRTSPYAPSGTFISRVFDAGAAKAWGGVMWTSDVPANTSLAISVRTGDTPTPDGTWSSYNVINGSGDLLGVTSRYIQYKADFTTSDTRYSSQLRDISISCADPVNVPAVTTQPASKSGCVGTNVTFTSGASGNPAPIVQWQVSTDGTNWTDITTGTSASLTFAPTMADDGKQYRAVWTNSLGVVNSNAATLTVHPVPSAPSVSVINNCGNSVLTASGFVGSLLWNNSATTSSITVTDAATYTVAQTVNGCVSAPASGASAPIAIPSAPTVTVTDNCGSSILTASDFTGSLLWNNNATTSSITVNNAATYTVTQTLNGCISPVGTGTSAPKEQPAAPIVGVSDNCGNSVLTASNYTGALLWSEQGQTTTSITVTAPGTYSVSQNVGGCISPVASGIAAPKTIPSAPTVSVVNNCGNSVLTADNFTGSLLWSNSATTSSITVTDASTYTVTQSINGCSSPTGSGLSNPKPVPSTPTVTVVDNCGNSVLTAGNFSGPILWSNGSTASSITVTDAATYTVTQTLNGCSATGSGVSAPRAIPTSPNMTVTNHCGNSVLTATNYTGTLLWSNGANTPSITVTNAATYTVTQTINGCSSPTTSGSGSPLPVPAAPVVTVRGATTFCEGGFAALSSNMKIRNLWNTGSTDREIIVTASGSYSVTYTAENGCTSLGSIPVIVTVNPTPSAPSLNVTDNCGNSTLTAGTYTGSLLWNTGATTPSITVTIPATYNVKQVINGCASAATSGIASPKTIPVTPLVTVNDNCGSSLLTASNITGTLSWSNGATTSSINVTNAATYSVTQTGSNGCISAAGSGTSAPKTIPTAPSISADGPTSFCPGGSVTLTSSEPNNNTWSTGATSQSISVSAAGSYTVSFVAANGCSSPASTATGVSLKATSTSTTNATVCSGQLPYVWNNNSYADAGTYTVHLTNAAGCDSAATLILTIGGIKTSDTTVTACDNYLWNANNYTTSGVYTFPTISVAGCDSIATLHLIINHSTTSDTTVSACDSYIWNGNPYTESGIYTFHTANAVGCDSIATLHLTIGHASTSDTTISACESYLWNGTPYTESGIYTYHATNAAGCDSTVTLHLTINHSTTSDTTVNACNSYFWNGSPYSESGVYTFHTTNAAGCDSIATLHLTIHQSPAAPTITAESATTFCQGGSVVLTSSAATGNTWSTGATTQSITATIAGTYTVSYVDGNGCTSVVSLPITVTVNMPTSSDTTVSACESFTWNGDVYTISGTYTKPFIGGSAAGCDSTAILHLTINHSTTSDTTISACNSYVWNGNPYTESGVYTFHTTNALGCDSIATLHLTIHQSPAAPTITAESATSFCQGGSIVLTSSVASGNIWSTNETTQSITVSTSGSYTVSFTDGNGCTSLSSLPVTVTVNVPTSSDTTVTACESFSWNGDVYTTSGTYTKPFIGGNAAGCDSTAILHLTINHSSTSTTTISACDSYSWNGTTYNESGTYTKTFIGGNAAGCDSTATLILTIHQSPAAPSITAESATTFCQGGSVVLTSSAATGNTWSTNETTQSITVSASGTYTVTFTDGNGCTSAASLPVTVAVNVPTTSTTDVSICESAAPFNWNDHDYAASGSYTINLTNAAGCDSAATLNLVINPASVGGTVSSDATVCQGSNSGLLTLSGQTGAVIRWEQSTDGGTTWTDIANTTITLNYSNLSVATIYRAVVKSGACSEATSSTATISMTANSVGGSVSGATAVCSGTNSGTVTLSGNTGNVIRWEKSTDGGGTWASITNTTTSLSYTNITQTTMYRAVVQNSPCTFDNSSAATIIVNPVSVGGSVSGTATLCSLTNNGTLTLSGHTGNVVRWESSIDGGTNWSTIANTTTTQSYTNILKTTQYRAVVQSGNCATANSSVATLTINAVSTSITVSPDSIMCSGSSITFTATVVNGGTTPAYSWKRNGTTVGSNSSTFTANNNSYANNDVFTVVVTSNATCVVGNPATSNAIRITKYPTSVGGSVSSNQTECSLINSGTLTLTGQTGTIIRWEQSINGGTTWTTIANTTTSLTYTNLAQTTQFRAVVQSGICSSANSSSATVTVTPVTGGTTTGSTTVCSGANTGSITLSGQSGTITRWESSTNGGSTWNNISNSTATLTYNNITSTTMYRVRMTNGTCFEYSTVATITTQQSVGGTASGAATYCSLTNSGTVTLSGQTGNVIRWEQSINGGTTWTTIANTTTSLVYANLAQTTQFRAVVQIGTCASANSTAVTITVTPVAGGTTTGSTTVCSGTNSGTITLSGQQGSVSKWMRSTNGGSTWTNVNNTTTSLTYSNITQTSVYCAVLTNGTCTDTSTFTTISVDPVSVGGTVSGASTYCTATNSGTVTLGGQTGNVIRWEQSINGGTTWTTIANTTTSQSYSNLAQTTLFRAVVQSGTCASANSSNATITVSPVAGGITTGSTTVCATANSGTITLSGQLGTISKWMRSTNGGSTWTNITNATTSQTYSNLTQTTVYCAVMTNGTCTDTSTFTTITVNPASVGGTASGTATVCLTGNSGSITLSGQTGTVIRWEQSINGGTTWTTIANTTTSQTYTNLTQTTLFRAVVQSGVCASANSSNATITVTQIVGGTTTGPTSVCTGTNSGSITLSGQTGSVSRWESSINGGTTWTNITNTTTTQAFSNLTQTTMYRARITAGTCFDYSTVTTVTVNPLSVGGTVSGTATVCSNGNNGTLTLSGNTGNVVRWEQSINSGSTWTTIANTTTSQSYTNLTQTTMFRAVVQSGPCSSANSAAATITVTQIAGGTTSGAATVCAGLNSGTVTLSGNTGSIIRWETSTNGGGSWTNIANTTVLQSYTNLTQTTDYRALIQNGSCQAYSSTTTINVTALPTLSSGLTANAISGVPFTYAATSATGGATFAWTRAAVAGISNTAGSGTGDVNETLDNTAGIDVVVTYVYTLTGPTGCINVQNVLVTVSPSSPGRIITLTENKQMQTKPKQSTISEVKLEASAMPNPTTSYFNLIIKSSTDKAIGVRVMDAFGKVIENHQKVSQGTMRLGQSWAAGVYLIEVMQGEERKVLKIIKTN